MQKYTYYALRVLSDEAIAKAIELGMNQNSYNFKAMSDPRREGYYLFLVVDTDDGYILNSTLTKDPLGKFAEANDIPLTYVN
jgi:hypothetical protein